MQNLVYGDKKIMYNAAHHANERITSLVLMRFIEDYCNAYEDNSTLFRKSVRNMYERVSIYLVPMVNPDGVDLSLGIFDEGSKKYMDVWGQYKEDLSEWKANIRGVDLKNYQPVCKVL